MTPERFNLVRTAREVGHLGGETSVARPNVHRGRGSRHAGGLNKLRGSAGFLGNVIAQKDHGRLGLKSTQRTWVSAYQFAVSPDRIINTHVELLS
jgi:hypothetical protein